MDFKRVFAYLVVVVVNLMLDGPNFCNGARTGDFLRKKDPSLDMPLDSDVFTIPSGYNAPQQVPTFNSPLNYIIFISQFPCLLPNKTEANLKFFYVSFFFFLQQ